jgi:hypothetical protein
LCDLAPWSGLCTGTEAIVVSGYKGFAEQEGANGHDYGTLNKVCDKPLTLSQQAELLEMHAIPGREGERITENGTYFVKPFQVPGGFVTTEFNKNHTQVVNTVTRFHPFSGSITRTIFTNARGTFIRTIGSGNAGSDFLGRVMDKLNDAVGPTIFNYTDSRAKGWATAFMGCFPHKH